MEFDFDEADLLNTIPCASWSINGRRRAGKTQCAGNVCEKLSEQGMPRFVAFCGNKDNETEWGKKIPPLYIHPKNPEAVVGICRYQEQLISGLHRLHDNREEENARNNPGHEEVEFVPPMWARWTVIFDDCGNDDAFMRHPVIKRLTTEGRHFGADVIFLVQSFTQLSKENRRNIEYVILVTYTSDDDVDHMYKEYITSACVETPSLFRKIVLGMTEKIDMSMLIHTSGHSFKTNDKIKFIKTRLVKRKYHVDQYGNRTPKFVGSHSYIQYSRKHYLSRQRQEEAYRDTTATTTTSDIAVDPSSEPDYDEIGSNLIHEKIKRDDDLDDLFKQKRKNFTELLDDILPASTPAEQPMSLLEKSISRHAPSSLFLGQQQRNRHRQHHDEIRRSRPTSSTTTRHHHRSEGSAVSLNRRSHLPLDMIREKPVRVHTKKGGEVSLRLYKK